MDDSGEMVLMLYLDRDYMPIVSLCNEGILDQVFGLFSGEVSTQLLLNLLSGPGQAAPDLGELGISIFANIAVTSASLCWAAAALNFSLNASATAALSFAAIASIVSSEKPFNASVFLRSASMAACCGPDIDMRASIDAPDMASSISN